MIAELLELVDDRGRWLGSRTELGQALGCGRRAGLDLERYLLAHGEEHGLSVRTYRTAQIRGLRIRRLGA